MVSDTQKMFKITYYQGDVNKNHTHDNDLYKGDYIRSVSKC